MSPRRRNAATLQDEAAGRPSLSYQPTCGLAHLRGPVRSNTCHNVLQPPRVVEDEVTSMLPRRKFRWAQLPVSGWPSGSYRDVEPCTPRRCCRLPGYTLVVRHNNMHDEYLRVAWQSTFCALLVRSGGLPDALLHDGLSPGLGMYQPNNQICTKTNPCFPVDYLSFFPCCSPSCVFSARICYPAHRRQSNAAYTCTKLLDEREPGAMRRT